MRSLVLVFALGGLMAATPAAQVDRQMGGYGVLVFENQNFGGRNATFIDDTPDLSGTGLDRRITSLRVARDEVWQVCTERNYRGRCQLFSGDEPDLRRVGWSDVIASLRRVSGGQGRGRGGRGNVPSTIELFAGTNFSGQRLVVREAVSNLRELNFNDRASSLRVTGTGEWEVCVNANYDDCRVVDRDLASLNDIGLNREISSIRPRPFGGGSVGRGRGRGQERARIILYDGLNFRGRSREITADTPVLGFFSNTTGSLRVDGGRWELCEELRYGGRCVTVTEDVPDLRVFRLSDRISSVRRR